MAEIDGSIPASVGKNIPNPMEQMAQTAQVMQGVNANRLFMAKARAGQLLQQAIDPQTGQPDLPKFNRLLAADPRTAPFAGEALTQSLSQQGQGIQNATGQTALQAAQVGNLRRVIASVPPGPKQADQVVSAIARGEAAGLYSHDVAARFMGGQPLGDGTSISDFVKQAAIASESASAQSAQAGDVSNIDTGSKIQPTAINRFTGTSTPVGAPIDKELSPESAGSLVPIVDPTGVPKAVPKSAIETPTGQPKVGPLTDATGAVTTGLAPGVGAAADTAGTGSAAILNSDRADQASSAQRVVVLKHVNDLLNTPEGKTGPGTQVVNGWRSFLLANAPAVAAMTNGGVDEAKLRTATQDELHKYMVQMAGNAASQYGAGTNEKLAVAASGNANADISTLANQDVTRMNLALERAKQARMAAWDASGQPPQDYGKFVSGWNRTHDPRAFMLDLLSPKDRAKMFSGITSEADKKAFLSAKRAAESAGLFTEKDIPR